MQKGVTIHMKPSMRFPGKGEWTFPARAVKSWQGRMEILKKIGAKLVAVGCEEGRMVAHFAFPRASR